MTCWAVTQLLGLVCLVWRWTILEFSLPSYSVASVVALGGWYLLGRARRAIDTRWVAVVVSGLVSLGVTLLWFTSAAVYSWLRQFITAGMYTYSDAEAFVELLASYLLGPAGVGFAVTWAAGFVVWYRLPRATGALAPPVRRALTVLGVVAVVSSVAVPWTSESGGLLPPDASFATGLVASTWKESDVLRVPEQRLEPDDEGETDYNVLVIVNEAFSREGLASFDASVESSRMPRLEEWFLGEGERSMAFERHFTPSSRTHLSIPTLMTGVGPYESLDDLHRAPVVWHWAKAKGMATIFSTAEVYRRPGMDKFFLEKRPPDRWMTADRFEERRGRGHGVDDFIAIDSFLKFLDEVPDDKPVFGIISTFATHYPYQTSSSRWDGTATGETPYRRASDLLDAGLARVLDGWREAGRLENSFVFITGDHGRSNPEYHDVPRAFSMYDDVMRLPLMVRVPESFRREHPEAFRALRQNRERMTNHADVVPTIVDVLGLLEDETNRDIAELWTGRTLTEPVPRDRTFIAYTSDGFTSWGYDAIGIFWPGKRFIASTQRGSQFYDLQDDPYQQHNVWPDVPDSAMRRIERTLRDSPRLRDVYRDIVFKHDEVDRFDLDAYAPRER